MAVRRRWHHHAVAAPALLGGLLVIGLLAALLPFDGAGARPRPETATTTRALDAPPMAGEPCRNTHDYPVKFVADTNGQLMAVFMLAGGVTSGSLDLSPTDVQLASTHDAYVTDVQLGSYESSTLTGSNGTLVCRLNPTFHFYCPTTNQMDRLCLTWVSRQGGDRVPGAT
jgi:hypothetical protein